MKRAIGSVGVVVVLVFWITLGCQTEDQKISFKDVSEEAGLQPRPGGGIGPAFGDYDNDGDIDIYHNKPWVGGKPDPAHDNRLWENDGKGNFTEVASLRGVANEKGLGRGVSWGDYDNDGDLDLIVSNHDSSRPPFPPPTTLFKNMLAETGQPNFVNATVAAGVLRKDNPRDVARGGVVGTSAGVGWGDYNNDGYLDIYWRSAGTDPDNILFKNNSDGTFTDVTEESGVSLVGKMCDPDSQGSPNWVDYDNDGDLDLYVGNEGSANILFQNRGGGTFVDVTTVRGAHGNAFINPGNANGACWGDIDNDGDLDCYIANADQANRLIRNDLIEEGEPGFTDITFESGTGDFGGAKGCTVGDYDNDGDLDIYVSNGGPSNVLIQDVNPYIDRFAQFYVAVEPAKNVLYSNNGDGTFTDVTVGSGAEGMGEGRGVASGDVNDDGFIDLFVTNVASASGGEEQEGALLLNTGNSNNWIKIALVGTVSNRSAIGARVKVVSGDLTQMCEVASATGYNSADDPRANFGLGSRTEVDRIEVTWPTGVTQTFTDPETTKINTVHTITEPTPRS